MTTASLRAVSLPHLNLARAAHPALQGLYAFAVYLAVFVTAYAQPLIYHLNTPNLRQYWTDPNFYTWAMQWWPYAVTHGVNPLFSSQIGAPHGYDLAWATTTPSVALLMWPVTALFGILVSYNVMLLLVPPVSAWAAFIAARRLTKKFWPALCAGAVYGFCPYELVHDWQGQPNLTAIALFPLMVYLVVRWWQGSMTTQWFVASLALAMALEFYTFNEAYFDMTVAVAGGLLIGYAVAGSTDNRQKVARLAAATGIAYAGSLVLSAPDLIYALKHSPTTFIRQEPEFSLNLVRLVLPWSDKVFGISALATYTAHVGRANIDDYVGLPLLLVLVGVAVFVWRSRVSRLLVIGFLFALALAAGPVLVVGTRELFHLPWGGLWNLPLARSAEPSRFTVFLVLALAFALALWLAAPVRSTKPISTKPISTKPIGTKPIGTKPISTPLISTVAAGARWALGLLAVAAVLFVTPTVYPAIVPIPPGYRPPAGAAPANALPPFIADRLYRHYLRPGETVVIVTHRGNAGMLFQAAAGFYFRIAGGFINASLTAQNALPHAIALAAHPSKTADSKLAAYLKTSGVGAIVVEHAWEDTWMRNFSTKLGMRGISVGGVTVYPVAPWLATEARLAAFPHRTDRPHHQPQPTQQPQQNHQSQQSQQPVQPG